MTSDSEPRNNVRPRDDLSIETVDENLLILDKRSEKIHQLNREASMIWSQLASGSSPHDIAAKMTEKYDVSMDIALRDVLRTVEEFSVLNLLQTDSDDQTAS